MVSLHMAYSPCGSRPPSGFHTYEDTPPLFLSPIHNFWLYLEAVNRLVLALALENRNLFEAFQKQTFIELAELQRLLEQQARNVDKLAGATERTEEYLERHPTLLYLLRFRTKETVAVILLIFVLLSAWYVSGFRMPILRLVE